jgi:hypothetical protein
MSKLSIALLLGLSVVTIGCKKKGGGAAADAIAKMEDLSKQMCECRDKTCADKVNGDMTKWGTEMARTATANKDEKPDAELTKKSPDIMSKYTECMTKLIMPAAEPKADVKGSAEKPAGSDAAPATDASTKK